MPPLTTRTVTTSITTEPVPTTDASTTLVTTRLSTTDEYTTGIVADITTDVVTTTEDISVMSSPKPSTTASTLTIVTSSTPGMSYAPPTTPKETGITPVELRTTEAEIFSTQDVIQPTTLQNVPDRTELVNVVGLVIGATLGALVVVLGSMGIAYQRSRKKHSAKITTLELKEHLYNGPPDCTITIVEMKPLPSSKFTRISPDLTI
ncbi:uncharacterized protein LOC144872778 [Branchiostoma floridae x Branchiostoma japonicum]